MRTCKETENIQYGITSLHPSKASAERLLSLRRGHWSIENKSHWIRDTVLGDDASPIRCGVIPQVMAALRNTVLSVLRFAGYNNLSCYLQDFEQKDVVFPGKQGFFVDSGVFCTKSGLDPPPTRGYVK